MNPEDLFANLFGGGFKGRPNAQKPIQKEVEIVVTLEDIYNGETKSFEIKRTRSCKTCKGQGTNKPNGQTKCMGCNGSGMKTTVQYTQFGEMRSQSVCNDCRGEGTFIKEGNKCGDCRGGKVKMEIKKLDIDIQKGVKEGNFYVFSGEGDEIPNKKTGDLIVILKLAKHKHFVRKGADLYYNLKINLLEALTGFEASIPHFNGNNILVKTRPGEVIKPGILSFI
jgi:DnaJ-class molecular chaperone